MSKLVNRVSLYIITEKTIENIFKYEVNIDEDIKNKLNRLIKSSFINFCDLFYNMLKYYFIPSLKDHDYVINKKDEEKIQVLIKFVSLENIFVIDVYDYLFSTSNINSEIFSIIFYDYLGSKMTELNISFEESYQYFYYIENLFNLFILSTIFNRKFFENEENIVLGVDYYNWEELRILVCED